MPSDDLKYLAEAYGDIKDGEKTYDVIRVIRKMDEKVVWEKKSEYLSVYFHWSVDSNYLGINYSTRTHADTIVLDIEKLEVMDLPDLTAIASIFGDNDKPRDDSPDPEFGIYGWQNNETIIINCMWTTVNDELFESKISYNLKTKAVAAYKAPTCMIKSNTSPDGRYRAEAYATLRYGFFESYDGIRIIRQEDEEIAWSMTPGYYIVEFLWSTDSKYLVINYSARTYSDSIIIDINNKDEIALPSMNGIAPLVGKDKKPRDYRPDPVFNLKRWVDHETVAVAFKWITVNDDEFEGVYSFNIRTGEINLM
jgi:hypothetical protein